MNQTLKMVITKMELETGMNCVSLLPFALLCAQCTLYVGGISTFKALCGRHPPLIPKISEEKIS